MEWHGKGETTPVKAKHVWLLAHFSQLFFWHLKGVVYNEFLLYGRTENAVFYSDILSNDRGLIETYCVITSN